MSIDLLSDAAAMLELLEYANTGGCRERCPSCSRARGEAHDSTCGLSVLLFKLRAALAAAWPRCTTCGETNRALLCSNAFHKGPEMPAEARASDVECDECGDTPEDGGHVDDPCDAIQGGTGDRDCPGTLRAKGETQQTTTDGSTEGRAVHASRQGALCVGDATSGAAYPGSAGIKPGPSVVSSSPPVRLACNRCGLSRPHTSAGDWCARIGEDRRACEGRIVLVAREAQEEREQHGDL